MDLAHTKTAFEVLGHFSLDPRLGLSETQVHEARAIYGNNELVPDRGTPFWKLVLKQFDDLLVKILLVAAVVDFVIALVSGEEGLSAFVEPLVILAILVANAIVGVVTETNAEKAIEELKAYEADVATVLRDGRLHVIPASELVPGDIVEIAVGSKVPADLRLVELLSNVFRTDQSILTGESGSVEKHLAAVQDPKAVYQDKTCLLYSGTVVTAGRARAVAIGTGQNTAIGQIRDAMAETEEELTPLKKKLDDFGTFLSKVIAVICVLVWFINIPRFADPMHGNWFQGALYYFKIAVALAVAAIPEGLPAVVTTCLALGTRKMAKRNAIVRSLPSVETLGCTTVICSDKTGTLTTNQMSVARLAVIQSASGTLQEFRVTGSTYAPEGSVLTESGSPLQAPAEEAAILQMAACCALCNDSTLTYNSEKKEYQRVGEATEVALRVLAEKVGLPGYADMPGALANLSKRERATFCNDHWQEENHRISQLEFSRDRKMMSVRCRKQDQDQDTLFVKGAPEAVIARCTQAAANDSSSSTVQLTGSMKQALMDRVEAYGDHHTLRCLALASRPMPASNEPVQPQDEQDLTLLGVVGMHDPPRPEVAAAMETCRVAGIRVIVVTGDNKATAESVCRHINALDDSAASISGLCSLTGSEYSRLAPTEQASAVARLSVFARVEPSHKSNLVVRLKEQGHVVAMTGDGVNDAPALKRADIGIAMGSGTAVAKHAADMVLADDNFATIVVAIGEGRVIYANTKQFIRYMVSSNIGEVVAIFSAALIGLPEVLNPVQLLWVNLVTDGLPATALGFNPPDKDIMRNKPRRTEDGIVNRWLFVRYLVIGLYVGCVTCAGFIWWYTWAPSGPRMKWSEVMQSRHCQTEEMCAVFKDRHPSTVAMTVLVVVEMFNALNALSENNSLLQLPPWGNLWLLGSIALSMALHAFILYVPPAAAMFSVTPLNASEWLAVLWLSFPVILVDEVLKYITRNWMQPGAGLPRVFSYIGKRVLPRRFRDSAAQALELPQHNSGPAEVERESLIGKRNGSPPRNGPRYGSLDAQL
ncbi:Calcium-transporting ATPase 3, endoplasmic reticulum-type [Coccomyxa viridis]|uniref:Calcium-transporting ATPase n=1 Tax=Coccomyxa viridis TaxID=1274662 RepID=A0AAV1IES4_9CHLO|nr:Calcium-transporting ATPase 3, endoplasmic reticulum-type [Coccomyxa viridis]